MTMVSREVSIVQQRTVTVCDGPGCGVYATERGLAYNEPYGSNWLILSNMDDRAYIHFCSVRCLQLWATDVLRRQESTKLDEPDTDAQGLPL